MSVQSRICGAAGRAAKSKHMGPVINQLICIVPVALYQRAMKNKYKGCENLQITP